MTDLTRASVALRLPPTRARWESAEFRAELTEWLRHEVGEPTSLEPVKIRPWAGVWRVETSSGVFYAKQNCEPQRHEAALLTELAALVPDRVVPVAAADLERGLLLTPDQGAVLGTGGTPDLDAWSRVVGAAAELQREVAPYAERLRAAGAVALAPADAATYVSQRIDDFASLPAGDPRGVPVERLEDLRRLLPEVERWADQVGALGLPLTLCHSDLHGNNVFDRNGRLVFFDFADSVLMEPLACLLIPLNVLRHGLSAEEGDPRLVRVVEPALEVWSDLVPLAELRRALPAALQLAKLARSESWVRCTQAMDDAELAEWGDSGGYWLTALLEPTPLGPATA